MVFPGSFEDKKVFLVILSVGMYAFLSVCMYVGMSVCMHICVSLPTCWFVFQKFKSLQHLSTNYRAFKHKKVMALLIPPIHIFLNHQDSFESMPILHLIYRVELICQGYQSSIFPVPINLIIRRWERPAPLE